MCILLFIALVTLLGLLNTTIDYFTDVNDLRRANTKYLLLYDCTITTSNSIIISSWHYIKVNLCNFILYMPQNSSRATELRRRGENYVYFS